MNSVENGITTEQMTAACGDGQVNIFKANGTTFIWIEYFQWTALCNMEMSWKATTELANVNTVFLRWSSLKDSPQISYNFDCDFPVERRPFNVDQQWINHSLTPVGGWRRKSARWWLEIISGMAGIRTRLPGFQSAIWTFWLKIFG